MLFFIESWYVVIRQRCRELFKLGGVCSKLSKVMFVSGSLKLIRTSSRGLGGGAGVVHYALLRGVWVWTSLFQTKPWSGLETSTNPHPLTYCTWRGMVSHGFLTLHFSMLTLRNTITASSKDLECKERKRSWKHNGFDPLEQPLRLGQHRRAVL